MDIRFYVLHDYTFCNLELQADLDVFSSRLGHLPPYRRNRSAVIE